MREAVNIQQPAERDPAAFAAAFRPWLRECLGWADAEVTMTGHPVGTGSSNESILAVVRRPGGDDVAIVVRVLGRSVTTYYDPSLERQAAVMRWVAEHTAVPVPAVLAVETSTEPLGAPFLVMERSEGQAPPEYPIYNAAGFLVDATPAFRRTLWRHALGTMAELHRADASSLVALGGDPAGGLRRLLAYWRSSYAWMAASCDVSPFEPALAHLERTAPTDAPIGISWGDARITNMLFVDGRVRAVLDWEMASLGGPLVDLAWWLMFDRIHADDFGLARLDGLGGRTETIEAWCRASGLSAHRLAWHEAFVHLQLCLGRTTAFAQRARAGLPVPGPDDARSVEHLRRRLDALLAQL